MLLDTKGEPYRDIKEGQTKEEAEIVTLSNAVVGALLATYQGETLTGKQKYDRYKLALRFEESEIDVTAEEVVLIKDVVAKMYDIHATGRVYDALEK